nr:protein LEO1 homolog isoform X1 [Tanacetum cinerariifolium]
MHSSEENMKLSNPWLCGFIGFLWNILAAGNVVSVRIMDLLGVYAANGGDMEATLDMLDQLQDKGDVGMKPEGDDVVEGRGETEIGSDSDGELQEVDQEHIESESERDQSSQEVDLGDQRDERDESEEKIQKVTKLVKELLPVGGEKWWRATQEDQRRANIWITQIKKLIRLEVKEDNCFMHILNYDFDSRSPEEEKDEAHISVISPKIHDVFRESNDEKPADYEATQTNV